MYLNDIINSNISLIKKINHIEFAISNEIKIPSSFWKVALKKHPNILTYNYDRDKSILYGKNHYNSGRTNLFLEMAFSRNNWLRKKNSVYDFNMKNLLEVSIPRNNKIKRLLTEEIIFSRNLDNIILILNSIPNLNSFFKDKYQKVTSTTSSIKLFKYLKKRGFDFSQERFESFSWFFNYIQTGLPITPILIRDFFQNFNYSFKLEDISYENVVHCLNKVHDSIILDNSLINEVNLFNLDRLIVKKDSFFYKDEKSKSKILDIRDVLFKAGNELDGHPLSKINKDIFYPEYMDEYNFNLVVNNFCISKFISNENLISTINRSILKKEKNITYFIPSKDFSKIMHYKENLPSISETELMEITEYEHSFFENFLMDFLKKQYDERTVFEFYKDFSSEETFLLREKIQDLERNIKKYDRTEMEILFPKNAKTAKDLMDSLALYEKRSRFYFNSLSSKLLNKKTVKDYTLKMGESHLFNKMVQCGFVLNDDFNYYNDCISFIYKNEEFKGILILTENNTNFCIKELDEKIDITFDDIKGFLENVENG